MVNRFIVARRFNQASRAILGLLFVYAGLAKLLNVASFAGHVADFGIVPDRLVKVVAVLVCVIEIVAGAGLVLNRRSSLLAIVGLLVCFVLVLTYGLHIGLNSDCGCLGLGYSLQMSSQLIVDIVLLSWCGLLHWSVKRCKADR